MERGDVEKKPRKGRPRFVTVRGEGTRSRIVEKFRQDNFKRYYGDLFNSAPIKVSRQNNGMGM